MKAKGHTLEAGVVLFSASLLRNGKRGSAGVSVSA